MARLGRSPAARLQQLADREGEAWVAKRLSGRDVNFLSRRDVELYTLRDNALKEDGFMPWERMWFSLGTITSPAMRALRRKRVSEMNAYFYAAQTKRPQATYEDLLKNFNRFMLRKYQANDWLMKISGDPDPYAQLEALKQQKNIQDSPRKRQPRKKLAPYDEIVKKTEAKEKKLGKGQRDLQKYARKRGRE